MLSASKRAFLLRLLPAVSHWLSAAFRNLRPVAGALSISSNRPCGFGGRLTIPQSLLNSGSASTDLLIFVTARPTAGSALAFAGHCQEDGGLIDGGQYIPRRPTVGHLNIDPAAIESGSDDEGAVDRMLKVLLHETFHVLGFTHDKLVQFPCPDAPGFDRYLQSPSGRRMQSGDASDPISDPAAHGLRACSQASSIEPIIVLGSSSASSSSRPRRLLATPRVVATARRHFNCLCNASALSSGGCIEGIPLEDCMGGGDCLSGSGTEASHWEKRVMLGELMVGTASSGNRATISDLTLAVFADSGWFEPVYDVQAPRCFYNSAWCADADVRDRFVWGRDRGCAFVTSNCDGDAWRAPGYWCAADPLTATPTEQRARIDAEGCTLGRLAVGHCTLREHSSAVPSEYRYFGPSMPNFGGRPMEDYCPLMTEYVDWDCRMPATTSTAIEAELTKGEARGESSRCFESTLYNSSTLEAAGPYHGCYPHRCLREDRLQVYVAGRWHDCPGVESGSSADSGVSVAGWSGLLQCPPAAELCARATDLNWPDISSVAPSSGPADGGTSITISGDNLYADGSANGTATDSALPRVLVCGIEADGVRAAEPSAATPPLQRVVATTPVSTMPSDALNMSCHVTVWAADGREAIATNAFRYVREPLACTILSAETFDWSIPQLTSLYICLWPYILSGLAGLWVLRGGYKLHKRATEHSRTKSAWEVTQMRDGPL